MTWTRKTVCLFFCFIVVFFNPKIRVFCATFISTLLKTEKTKCKKAAAATEQVKLNEFSFFLSRSSFLITLFQQRTLVFVDCSCSHKIVLRYDRLCHGKIYFMCKHTLLPLIILLSLSISFAHTHIHFALLSLLHFITDFFYCGVCIRINVYWPKGKSFTRRKRR